MNAKRLLATASVLTLLATPALAADLAPVIVAPPVVDLWSGFYLGINLGVAEGSFDHPFTLSGAVGEGADIIDLATGSIDVSAGGFIGGVQAGYNFALNGNIVVGIEGDLQGSGVDGRVSVSVTDLTGALVGAGEGIDIDAGTQLDYFGTIRGRAGVTYDRALIYGTAGLAFGRTTSSVSATAAGVDLLGDISSENDRMGWTVGLGVEYALTDNMSFKTEYLYTDLGSEDLVSGEITDGVFGALSSDVAFSTVRAGLNFRF